MGTGTVVLWRRWNTHIIGMYLEPHNFNAIRLTLFDTAWPTLACKNLNPSDNRGLLHMLLYCICIRCKYSVKLCASFISSWVCFQCDTDDGISSDSESPTSVHSLIRQMQEKERQILHLETEVARVSPLSCMLLFSMAHIPHPLMLYIDMSLFWTGALGKMQYSSNWFIYWFNLQNCRSQNTS